MNFSVASGGTGPPTAEPKRDTLGRRTLSALVLVPIVLGLAWLGGWPFTAMVALAALLMTVEWDRLCRAGAAWALAPVSAAVVLLALTLAGSGRVALALVAVALGIVLVAGLAPALGRRPLWPALGVLYVGLPCITIVWLRAAPDAGRETIFWLLALVWATDIGAYAVGRAIGGARLAPRISPGKTWSGLGGGIACAALVGALAAAASGGPGVVALAALSAGLAAVAQLGDLAESSIKRRFGAADSGHLIPGHGGILDRVDGLLFAALALGGLVLLAGKSPLVWS